MIEIKRWAGLGLGSAMLLTLGGCEPSVTTAEFAVGGYAVLQGEVVRANGSLYSGNVFIMCGLEEPDFFGGPFPTVSPGRYYASLELPHVLAPALAAQGWRAICRISAPGGSPPFASAVDTVVFAPTKQERVENTIDLREE